MSRNERIERGEATRDSLPALSVVDDVSLPRLEGRVPARRFVSMTLVLCSVVVVLGSVGLGRLDWAGMRMSLHPEDQVLTVVDGCVEHLGPYTTESGRNIEATAIDNVQYMSLVRLFRGADRAELPVDCLYSPYTYRPGSPLLASVLPFDEAVALGLVNLAFTLTGIVFAMAAMWRIGVRERPMIGAGMLMAASWNVLLFSGAILVDAAPMAFAAASWYLMVRRKWLWVIPVILASLFFKESAVAVVVPALLAAAWAMRARNPDSAEWRRPLFAAVGGVVGFALWLTAWHLVTPTADARFPASPSMDVLLFNLSVTGLVGLGIGLLPLFLPTFLWWRNRRAELGWFRATVHPVVAAVLASLLVGLWSGLVADLSPRLLWPAMPFAATGAALWFSNLWVTNPRVAIALERVHLRSRLPRDP